MPPTAHTADPRPEAPVTNLPPRLHRVLESPRTTVVLVAVAALAAVLIQRWVYPAFSWNRDEPVYLWQVDLLRNGLLSSTDGGYRELLHPWLSAWNEGQFFTQYPLGWPIVIFASSLIGWPGGALSVAAALATSGVIALANELFRSRIVANVAGLVFLFSPIFAVQGGVYLTYLFTLGLGLWFTTSFLAAVRTHSIGRAVTAGLLFGWIACTRTFDAVLWGSVAGIYVGIIEWGAWRRHLRIALWFVVAVVPFAVLQALHNRALTGSVFSFPITVKDPLDTFGFGQRRLMPSFEPEGYGPRRALVSTAKHGFFLPWFLFGAYLGVAVAAVTAWARRKDHAVRFLLAIGLAFPVGYFSFWGTYVSSLTVRLSGPIYFVPLYAPLAILIAVGIVSLARHRPRVALAVVVALSVLTVPLTTGRLGLNRELSRSQIAWRDSTADLGEPAVVVVAATAYLLFLNPYSSNAPDLDGDIVFATNAWPSLIRFLDEHPDRAHFLQRASLSTEDLLPSESVTPPEIHLTPIERVTGPAIEIIMTVTPPRDGEEVLVQLSAGGRDYWRTLTYNSSAGVPMETTWVLTTPEGGGEVASRGDAVVLGPGELTVTFGAAFGSATRYTRLTPLVGHRVHVRAGSAVEMLTPGINFRGRGEDRLRFPERWDEVFSLPELEVTVRPLPGGP